MALLVQNYLVAHYDSLLPIHVLAWHVEGGVEHKCGHQSQGVSLFDLHEEQERIMLTQPRPSGTKLSIMIKLYIV